MSARKSNRYWALVIIAGLIEIGWAALLKSADKIGLWLLAFALILVTAVFVYISCEHLPVGTVYAVFTGIGALGSVAAGVVLYGEPMGLVKGLLIVVLLVAIIAAVVGLRLFA
ncbi:MAG: SMR family transporter [Eggerthellaceae bacterium]|jgi:paired small multidrug resistance pump